MELLLLQELFVIKRMEWQQQHLIQTEIVLEVQLQLNTTPTLVLTFFL
jgi:hypothetical protein